MYLDPENPQSLADDEVYIPFYDEVVWDIQEDED